MKRAVVLGLAGLLITATVGLAAPAAQATELAPPCTNDAPRAPGLGTVYVDESGRVHLNPDAAGSDVEAYSAWAVDWAVYWVFCIEGLLPTDGAWCLAGAVADIAFSMDPLNFYFRYVYQYGNELILDIPALRADANRIVNCTITIS